MLLWLVLIDPAAALELRIAIQEGTDQVAVGSSTPANMLNGLGQKLGDLPPLEGFLAQAASGAVAVAGKSAWQIAIEPTDGGMVYIGDRWFRGKVRLVRTSQGVTAVNYVDLEDYLASVIGKEMYTTWPQETLKAQAVAARSYALFRRQKQTNRLYDLGKSTAYQVYDGVNSETLSTQTAVQATAGQILTHQGKVIEAVFHSSSGGHTENSEHVWSGAVPYLRGVPDFDQNGPDYEWTLNLTAAQVKQRLPGVGNIISMTPVQSTPNNRVKLMKIIGDAGSRTIKGRQLRKALGLKSTLFTVTPQLGLVAGQPGKVPTKPIAFQLQGRGYGHGLGMSQWGAYGMANQGNTYQQILQHYYRGATLGNL